MDHRVVSRRAVAARCRGLGVLAVVYGAGALLWMLVRRPCTDLVRRLAEGGLASVAGLPPAEALSAGCAWVVLTCACWLVATTSLTVVATVLTVGRADRVGPGRLERLARRTCPRFAHGTVRRLVLVGCGLALGSALAPVPGPTGPASADRPDPDLSGLALPDRTHGVTLQPERRQPRPRQVTVRPGESLWSIAAGLASRNAGDTHIDSAWRELYRHNHRVIGPDPDLIHPGTRLNLPTPHRPAWKERR